MRALVTGGGGFLGKAIAAQLLARGDEVRVFARADYPELREMGAETVRGDIANATEVAAAAAGCDVVFHVAAKAGVWGPYEDFYRTNVEGTRAVIAACLEHGVKRLVYTSSPSVVSGDHDLLGVDESVPYPTHYIAHYPKTKAEAERLVRAANGPTLSTVSLRPHLIWGPGDNHLVPRIVARARSGKLRKIGDGRYLVDSVYIDNAALAHLLAAEHLTPDSPVAGKVYFISQDEPVDVGELMDRIIAAAGLPPVTRSVPPKLAYFAGWLSEKLYTALGKKEEPLMTRFVAKQLSTAHYFDISAAKADFGYAPTVSIDEGMERLAVWLRTAAP
ncbi:MAG: NAD-dependent epimerase/dehydratase family protein [Bradymonadaceae bacterium]|nr:NAD-dependent epimerase/dehydratase family protein [Lujinxingiaceae bacterium]